MPGVLVELVLEGTPTGPAAYAVSMDAGWASLASGGTLVPQPDVVVFAGGDGALSARWPVGIPSGATLIIQAVQQGALSNAIVAVGR